MSIVGIQTRRYSTVVAEFARAFPSADVTLDGERFRVDSRQLESWCNNSRLKQARNFALSLGDESIVFFHDHPSEMGASSTALGLVEQMAQRKILRYKAFVPQNHASALSFGATLSKVIRRLLSTGSSRK